MAALRHALTAVPIAALLGAVVVLPRSAAFNRLSRLRAPGWTAIVPATILVGTFGPLVVPPLARALVLLAAVATPLLAVAAAVLVVRRLLLAAIVVVAAACAAIVHVDWVTQLGPSLLAALGCLTAGVALERLIPRRWLLPGVLAMSALDVVLLATGIGDWEAGLVGGATSWLPGIHFSGVQLGDDTIGYPDLFLAGLLGAALTGDRHQFWAAGLVFALTSAFGALIVSGEVLPMTVPLAVTLVVMTAVRAPRAGRPETTPL